MSLLRRFPHPMALLLGGVVVAALLTWALPAGEYERQVDAASGRELVVPGTWHRIDAAPVGPAAAVLAVPRGIVMGADIVVVVLFVGGAFVLLDQTGALGRLVGALVGRARNPRLVVVAVSLVFATLGALVNLHEEVIALVPVLLVLSRGLGYGPITALAAFRDSGSGDPDGGGAGRDGTGPPLIPADRFKGSVSLIGVVDRIVDRIVDRGGSRRAATTDGRPGRGGPAPGVP
jgi:uncharacterized ion transporter superfamily protein YfcC